MNLVFRIVFWILVVLIFVSITFSTFFITKQYNLLPVLNIDQSWNIMSSGAVYYNKLSKYESLYTSYDIYQDLNLDINNVSVHKQGKYLSSYRDIWTLHNFTGTWFIISQKWIWEMYIDTISKKWKVFVYAINTPAEVTLTSDNGDENYTTIYLAPWMYFEFRTWIWKNLNNADRLRISTVNKLWYISSLWELNIEDSLDVYFADQDSVLQKGIQHIWEMDSKKRLFLTNMLDWDITGISGYNYIQRYLHLFVNDEKKKVYYKNKLLGWYINLLQAKKIDISLIDQIKKDESKLRELDIDSHNELISMRWDLSSALNSMHEHEYISSKMLFAMLEKPIVNQSMWMYPLYSFALFSSTQWNKEISEQVTKRFFDSFAYYMQESENSQDAYDYFLYFLEQRLIFLLSWSINEQSIWSTLEVLSTYNRISQEAKYIEKNQKITQIYSITQILESIDIFLHNTYFQDQRNTNNLLVLKTSINLWGSRLSQLQTYIEWLYTIYELNKSLLNSISTRDIKIIENITTTKDNIDEYIAAMWSYETYKDKYDISKNTILNVDVISNEQFSITEDTGRKYIEQFIWITQESYTLTVIDELYYKIENLIIGGRKFDFDIYPYSLSKLKNISIDGELQSTQYTLDNIKEDWEIKSKTATEDMKSQYDFSRFFILTFLTRDQRAIENFEIEYKQEESKAEIVFKRDILLWDKWEFSRLKDFLNIEYSDISLLQEGNMYNILLNNIAFIIDDSWIQERKNIQWLINSEYILNSSQHAFKNLSLQIESERKGVNNTVIYEFGGTKISLIWNININLLETKLRELLQNFDVYSDIYDSVSSTVDTLIIEYTPATKKTRFKFDYDNKNFTIILDKTEIIGIYEGIEKVSSSPINISDIQDYLK